MRRSCASFDNTSAMRSKDKALLGEGVESLLNALKNHSLRTSPPIILSVKYFVPFEGTQYVIALHTVTCVYMFSLCSRQQYNVMHNKCNHKLQDLRPFDSPNGSECELKHSSSLTLTGSGMQLREHC